MKFEERLHSKDNSFKEYYKIYKIYQDYKASFFVIFFFIAFFFFINYYFVNESLINTINLIIYCILVDLFLFVLLELFLGKKVFLNKTMANSKFPVFCDSIKQVDNFNFILKYRNVNFETTNTIVVLNFYKNEYLFLNKLKTIPFVDLKELTKKKKKNFKNNNNNNFKNKKFPINDNKKSYINIKKYINELNANIKDYDEKVNFKILVVKLKKEYDEMQDFFSFSDFDNTILFYQDFYIENDIIKDVYEDFLIKNA